MGIRQKLRLKGLNDRRLRYVQMSTQEKYLMESVMASIHTGGGGGPIGPHGGNGSGPRGGKVGYRMPYPKIK